MSASFLTGRLLPAEYPELQRIRRELSLLSKLYSLYSSVTDSVAGYYDILWADLNIEKISAELQDFQNRWSSLRLQQDVLASTSRVPKQTHVTLLINESILTSDLTAQPLSFSLDVKSVINVLNAKAETHQTGYVSVSVQLVSSVAHSLRSSRIDEKNLRLGNK